MASIRDCRLSRGMTSTATTTRSTLTSKLFKLTRSASHTMMTRKSRTWSSWSPRFCSLTKRWSRLTTNSWSCTHPSRATLMASVRRCVGCHMNQIHTHLWSSLCQTLPNKYSNSLYQCLILATYYNRCYWQPGWTVTTLELRCNEIWKERMTNIEQNCSSSRQVGRLGMAYRLASRMIHQV